VERNPLSRSIAGLGQKAPRDGRAKFKHLEIGRLQERRRKVTFSSKTAC
jgi:hypothetical protein